MLSIRKKPVSFEVVVLFTPSLASVIVILAPGIAAPELSTTVPSMPLENCARAGSPLSVNRKRTNGKSLFKFLTLATCISLSHRFKPRRSVLESDSLPESAARLKYCSTELHSASESRFLTVIPTLRDDVCVVESALYGWLLPCRLFGESGSTGEASAPNSLHSLRYGQVACLLQLRASTAGETWEEHLPLDRADLPVRVPTTVMSS